MRFTISVPPSVPGWLRDGRRFSPGTVTVSAAAQEVLHGARLSVESLLTRHTGGDHGEVGADDAANNSVNAAAGGYVTSVYGVQRFHVGLSREQVWVVSLLREGWTYVCLQHEVGGIF
jgi:hypothetical protein